jgi:hypothetical protein
MERSNTQACAHSAKRRQQVDLLPQPNAATGSSSHGVDVHAMKRIAAMQARSGTVRADRRAPGKGDGGSSDATRRHSSSSRSRSPRQVMPDHPATSHRTYAGEVPGCPL